MGKRLSPSRKRWLAQIEDRARVRGWLIELVREQDGRCAYCDRQFADSEDLRPTFDHVVPRSRGGAHAKVNGAAACRSCNSDKGSMLVCEWRAAQLADMEAWHPERVTIDLDDRVNGCPA